MQLELVQIQWGLLVGGGSRYVQTLEQLSRFGPILSRAVCIVGRKWPLDYEGLGRIQHSLVEIRGRLDWSWMQPVCRELQERKPSLVMTHGFNAHFVVWACQRRLGHDLPVVCSYHGQYHPTDWRNRLVGPIYDRFTTKFFRDDALGIVAVAEHAKRWLASRGVAEKKIRVIHNGIETAPNISEAQRQRASYRERWRVSPDEFLIGAVGRLDPVKGHSYLIAAFALLHSLLPRLKMVIIGDGPQRFELEKRASMAGLRDAIIFPGPMPGASAALPAVDLFVLPSLSECHSMALLEAMQAGLPIVATNVGGNSESINHEEEGLLVPPADSSSLAEAIDRLIQNRSWASQIGAAAQARFRRDFTQDAMLRKTADWLLECAELARSRGITV